MAEELLGPAFEIHGGGLDLVFPHHENELAQSRALGHEFGRIWTHNGMLRFTGEKMGKSEGNVVTIRDALDRWGREALLLFFLRGHWSKPIDFSDETMEEAAARLATFRDALLQDASAEVDESELDEALADDFNTPEALAILHRWAGQGAHEQVRRGLALFGVSAAVPDAPPTVRELAEEREAARAARDFERADRLRESIGAEGWEVRDVEGGFQLVPK
jgi:cysteinyl-tRNA synthetase